jgi:hypothetical protein
MGQVDFSPEIQQARRAITAWTYLKKQIKGLESKLSSSPTIDEKGKIRTSHKVYGPSIYK